MARVDIVAAMSDLRLSDDNIWDHFDKHPNDAHKAICKYCHNHILRPGKKKTQNMWKHARKCHPVELGQVRNKIILI